MRSRTRALAVVLTAVLAVGAAACGGESEVGSGVKKGAAGGNAALRDTTTVPKKKNGGSTDTTQPTQTTAAAVTTAPPTTTPPTVNVIKIQDDGEGNAFDPLVQQVRQGQIVRWTNTSKTTARQIKFADNTFVSKMIPPGGHADWLADRTGTFNYTDGTRPYAQGQVSVY